MRLDRYRYTCLLLQVCAYHGHVGMLRWLLAAGATIPSNTTDGYLRKIRAAGGCPAHQKAHRQALATKFAAKALPRLPTDVAAQVVAFAFHVGYY